MKAKRFILMLLVMLGSVTGAWAQMTFISAVKISAEEGKDTNIQRLKNDGYTVIDQDLNQDAGGRYIYIGYKTTTNPAEAISGLIIMESGNGVDVRKSTYKTNPITYQGKNYYRCDSYGSNDDNCDLNRKAGGSDITLYYTKDGNTNHGATLLTELTAVVNNKNMAGYSYLRHWQYGTDMYSTSDTDVYGDANKGTGDDPIYFPCKYHTHNVTATFNWAADGNTCTANISCDCGMKSTNVPCTITIENFHPAPTCTEDGEKTCTAKVNRHGKDFVSDARDFFASRLGHDMVYHARVEPTYYKEGHYEYWICSHACDGIYYKDAERTESYSEYPVIPRIPVSYIDADGSMKDTCIDGEISESTTKLNAGWYIVRGANVQTGTIVCQGAVHLILVDGAKLTATSVAGITYKPAIQVSDTGASLTIYGQQEQTGQLFAIGAQDGAGIGGGDGKSGQNITINGGVITAQGGYFAAGIGGGYQGSGNNITINGGAITATGGDYGSGIGGGNNGSGQNITINGGVITATGGDYGSGIGGGDHGSGQNITINGGVITATGGKDGAGIGGGDFASGYNITINGGVINATGSSNASVIGGGRDGGSSDIHINSSLILTVNSTEIEHTSSEDLASALNGKRYATLTQPSITVNRAPDLDENFSTFYHKYADYTVPNEDATIYTAAVEDYQGETCLVLREIEGGVIPANTAVILRTEESTTIDLQPCADASGITVPANSLSGANLPMDAPDFCYILSYGQHGLGFYKYADGNALAAHKAYLTYKPGSAGAKALRMVFADDNEVDGIQRIENGESEIENSVIYNLNGMRLNKLQKGINIVNGKKIVVK